MLHSQARRLLRHLVDPRNRRLALPLVALSVVSAIATAGAPVLMRWPLLLAMLSPRAPFLALAAGSTPAPLFIVLGTARLCAADPFHYLLGRRFTRPPDSRAPRRFERWVQRWGTPGCFAAIVIRPIGRHLFFAGVTKSHPFAVAVADVLSTVTFLLALHAGAGLL